MANLTLRSVKGAPLTHEELDGNFEYFTGSINTINAATGSFITSADTSSFLTSADTASFITSADTGSFVTTSQTASLNISNALYTVNSALSASITSSATTSVCSYGVNVFEYVTPTNFATKLPQPTTGKSVTVINNSTSLLYVYPSNIGGNINNYPVDTPAILPPDGKPYEFICIKNPLPGAWTFSTPATGQYDSGEIEISVTAGTLEGYNPVVTAYDASHVGLANSFNSETWGYNGKNKGTIQQRTSGGYYYLAFRPDTAWKGISKIKVYTNILATVDEGGDPVGYTEVRLLGNGEADYYKISDGSIITNGASALNINLFRLYLNNTISGTPSTGSTAYTSANIGDAGTMWGEQVAFSDVEANVNLDTEQGTLIGNKSLGTLLYPFSNPVYVGTTVEKFYSSYISFQICPLEYVDYDTIPDFKFRFIIEYYQ